MSNYYPAPEKENEETPIKEKSSVIITFGELILANILVGEEIPYYGKVQSNNEKKIVFADKSGKTKSFSKKGIKIVSLQHEIGNMVSMSGLLSKKQTCDILNIIERTDGFLVNEDGNVFLK